MCKAELSSAGNHIFWGCWHPRLATLLKFGELRDLRIRSEKDVKTLTETAYVLQSISSAYWNHMVFTACSQSMSYHVIIWNIMMHNDVQCRRCFAQCWGRIQEGFAKAAAVWWALFSESWDDRHVLTLWNSIGPAMASSTFFLRTWASSTFHLALAPSDWVSSFRCAG